MQRYQFTKEQRATYEGLQVPFAVFQMIDGHATPLILSDGLCRLFGFEDREAVYQNSGGNMFQGTHPDDMKRATDAVFHFIGTGKFDVIYRAKPMNDSRYRIIHAAGKRVITESGARLAQVWYTDEGLYSDQPGGGVLNQQLAAALHDESVARASQYDPLTGLANMSYFLQLAEGVRRETLAQDGSPVLLYFDLGGMKFFNVKHGFAEGDEMLKVFARILERTFAGGLCCHISADQFAVGTHEDGLAEKLQQIFAEMDNGKYPPVHVGIYSERLEDVAPNVACDRAKLACMSLKGKYQSVWAYYSPEMRSETIRRRYIIENIDKAVKEGWIQVYYQPIVRAVSERICDEEALARWIDPVYGFLSPSEFIPALEESGMIYKLDLYMLEQVLMKLKQQQEAGIYLVPQSINLSRADFEGCDIVEEIRSRVDAAGVSPKLITIEITESVIGSNYDFMKKQVERFQTLGFPVWMDDFGSGYSSLHLLQSIKFDLLKFDMSFMRRLDEGEGGKIVLSELMHMAMSLDVDTVCEGVETLEQVRFLREIGCSKLQGYYFSKPKPFRELLEQSQNKPNFEYENPEESSYYEAVGRLNLYDLAVLSDEGEHDFQKTFSTLPMGIIEINGKTTRFVRSNQSYREFLERYFKIDLSSHEDTDYKTFHDPFMEKMVKTCCEQGSRSFFDQTMPDGTVVHSFARRIGINPVSGKISVAVAVLSVSDPSEETTYGEIARTLAADYYNICAVNLDTDQFIEYSSPVGSQKMAVERHGDHFFYEARRGAGYRLYESDRETFYQEFTKEKIIKALNEQGTFTLTYRVVDTGTPNPVYVNLKASRTPGSTNQIVIGVSIVDVQMRQKVHLEELQRERDALRRVMALSDGYLSLYSVDVETGNYAMFSSTELFDQLGSSKHGDDFFQDCLTEGVPTVYKDDQPEFLARVTRENVLRETRENGIFVICYRLVVNHETRNVILKAAPFVENGREKLVIGVREWKERKLD